MILGLVFALFTEGAAAGVPTRPVVLNERDLLRFEDYPHESLARSEAGQLTTEIEVDSSGKPVNCSVTESTGYPRLDSIPCARVLRAGRFEPAKDATGQPVSGTILLGFTFYILDPRSHPNHPLRYNLQVTSLPSGYSKPAELSVEFDATGRAVDCYVKGSSGDRTIDETACRLSLSKIMIPPPKAAATTKVRAVRTVFMGFSAK